MVVNSYWHRTDDLLTDSSKTNYERMTGQLTIHLTDKYKQLFNCDNSNRRIETHQLLITSLHSQ